MFLFFRLMTNSEHRPCIGMKKGRTMNFSRNTIPRLYYSYSIHLRNVTRLIFAHFLGSSWNPKFYGSRMLPSGVKTIVLRTCPLISNSARTELMSQPPPIKNDTTFPLMVKGGDVRLPVWASPKTPPAGSAFVGRYSAPPIHQSPCWLTDSLSRAAGL